MADELGRTLHEVSASTGIDIAVLKKHAQRGKLRTTRGGRRVLVSDDDLLAYLMSEEVARVADRTRGEPLEVVRVEVDRLADRARRIEVSRKVRLTHSVDGSSSTSG